MSMIGRNYVLTIQTNDTKYNYDPKTLNPPYIPTPISLEAKYITIKNPFTIEFTINRNADATSNNTMFLDVYNLAEKTRDLIFQDRWPNKLFPAQWKSISLVAGYDKLYDVFLGNVTCCTTLRNGADIITRIECFDGQETKGMFSAKTFTGNVTKQEVIDSLINDFTTIKKGTVFSIPGNFPRGVTVQGNTFELISKYTDNKCFVDLNKINVLTYDQYIPPVNTYLAAYEQSKEIPVINVDTGLLQIPQREESTIRIQTMFAPFVQIGQKIKLQSRYQTKYNGTFKVIGLQHKGIISDAIAGTLTSSFQLQVPIGGFV